MWGARHDQPYHVMGSDARRRRAARRLGGAQLEARRRGHRALQLRRRPGPVRARRLDAGDQPAHLGLRVELRRPRRHRGREGEPAHAEARRTSRGRRRRCNALCNSHELPDDREPERLADDAGPDGARLGRDRRHRRVRGAVRAERRRHAGRRRVVAEKRVALLHEMGFEAVIDRKAEGYKFWNDEHTQDPEEWRRLGKKIRELVGHDPDIVFEHPGRQTMGASVFVAKRGGMIITCAATSGFMIEYDNRYLWMNLKTLKGCHFANYREAWEANRLDRRGQDPPDAVEGATRSTRPAKPRTRCTTTCIEGKVGVLCLAPEEGLGVTDAEHARAAPRPDHAVPASRELSRRRLVRSRMTHCSPRSTTSPSRSTTSKPRSSTTATTFGCEVEHREVVESDGVEEALLKVADSYIQLLTPVRDDSPVAKYLENKGEGLHHVGYRVDDCAAALEAVKARGPPRHRRSAPAREPGHDRRVRAPQDRVRHADRARPGIAPEK